MWRLSETGLGIRQKDKVEGDEGRSLRRQWQWSKHEATKHKRETGSQGKKEVGVFTHLTPFPTPSCISLEFGNGSFF